MDTKYLKYSWEQLLDEESFISWITKNELNEEWENFLKKYPEIKKEVVKAREIINVLQDKHDAADEHTIQYLWSTIDMYNQQYNKRTIQLNIRRTYSWAASILLLFLFGIFTLLYWQGGNKFYQFTETFGSGNNEAYLILPAGDKIVLNKKNSVIHLNEAEGNLVVNDSIIRVENKFKAAEETARMYEIILPFGKRSELVLADGTKIWLNAGSKFAFPLSLLKNKREIYLEGEACFQVAKNEQPFLVNTEGVNIEVLGTFFNVSAYPEQDLIETVLMNGSISLKKSGTFFSEKVVLSPNQKADFSKSDEELTITSVSNAEEYVAWINGWLEYRRESLSSVLLKLERYYDVKFHLPSNFPADDKISGKLDLKESLENIMMILSDAAAIEYKLEGNEIFITEKRKS